MRRALAACIAVAMGAPDASASAGADGWRDFDAQRFEAAVQVWQGPAAQGDAEAQFGLGVAYDLGRGLPADPAAACAWYRRAGDAGLAAAAFNVAVMYDNRRCGPSRPDEAATWYAGAAARGHARAQYNLAQLYAAGDGVPRNPDQAAVWFRAAAAGGVAAAVNKLHAVSVRHPAPSGTPTSNTLTPAAPAVPGGIVRAAASSGTVPVAFVWTAPAQASPARFVIEVYALDAALDGASPREIYSQTLDESATLVPLPAIPARYAWRVLTVGTGNQHYATSPWRRFRTEPGAQP